MTFEEFCSRYELSEQEWVLCVFQLASYRYQKTIGSLLVDHQTAMLKHLARLRLKEVRDE